MSDAAFVPTGLYRKRILAERVGDNVAVWYEGDTIKSLYYPETFGFAKWAALADEQARDESGKVLLT